MSQTCDLAEHPLDFAIVAFLEHEGRNAKAPQFSSVVAEGVGIFFDCIANKDQGLHFEDLSLAPGMSKDFTDLGMAHATVDALHQAGNVLWL